MALRHFVYLPTGKTDVTDLEAVDEYTCDKCGRFMAPDLIIGLHVNAIDANGVTAHAEAAVHAQCAAAKAAELAEQTVIGLSA
jgi:hypothetical protein